MKNALLSLATALLLTTAATAAPHQASPGQDIARRDDRKDKDFNYGYDKKHKVTAEEKARWEAAHKTGQQPANRPAADKNRQLTAEEKARWEARKNASKADKKGDRKDGKDFNYGYEKNHKVTAEEKARWDEAHKNERRDGNRNDDRR
ncbi:hypothetical protein [Hymenobacter sediminicola]|uniref:Uncharacterized protein n=1 Tax=Hymenobacter sediminicola TaxID=2761579 RepID=A0A7G7W3P3_9BACT|nr:hypothetical protein [Hymenobacter sediminicola]QNH60986.1 hypothetical protein H4317_12425 [Hymenobacter sediminicola]